jgi:suppressor for copper-sensitivity B
MSYSPDRRRALMRIGIGVPAKSTVSLAGVPLTFTLVDGPRAVEARIAPTAAIAAPSPPAAQAARGVTGLAAALALALLGGLILNLMPCVLPVLSIKLLSVVGHGGGEARRVRAGFAASAAGIVASFLVLGTAAVALKEAGLAAGWGIQFQQPIFLAAMIVVLALFAGNLWGVFAIRLPGAVSDAAVAAGHRPGLAGHFFTGALATLLATPCSAPFLGTAVGFALARGPGEIYAVFLALGAGLALPYLAIAAAPRLATRLPRPGRWMVVLRRILGLALVGTAAWLAVVLAALAGIVVTVVVAALAAGAVGTLAVTRRRVGAARGLAWGAVAALAILALAMPELAGTIASRAAASAEAGPWRSFDAAAIADEVRLGRVVVVEVTADWCITCKVNKRAVLDRDPVRSRLARPDVTAMLADWTRPDALIARYLAGFGRYGIPFTAVYGPAAPGGLALPEILTDSAVLEGIAQAAGGRSVVAR